MKSFKEPPKGEKVDSWENSTSGNNTDIIQLDDKDYDAFDFEWRDSKDSGTDTNQTIYAAAFVDNHGNQKVLHISEFANSEPDLLRAITYEILKYPASTGWYTTGITRGSNNHNGSGGVSTAA